MLALSLAPVLAKEIQFERDPPVETTSEAEHMSKQFLLKPTLIIPSHHETHAIPARTIIGRVPTERTVG